MRFERGMPGELTDRSVVTDGNQGGDWARTEVISEYVVLVSATGVVEINLRTTEIGGAGVARIVFGGSIEGENGAQLTYPDQGWPEGNYLTWSLPLALFDAVLAILRHGTPIDLYVYTRAGQVTCTLAGSTATSVQS